MDMVFYDNTDTDTDYGYGNCAVVRKNVWRSRNS